MSRFQKFGQIINLNWIDLNHMIILEQLTFPLELMSRHLWCPKCRESSPWWQSIALHWLDDSPVGRTQFVSCTRNLFDWRWSTAMPGWTAAWYTSDNQQPGWSYLRGKRTQKTSKWCRYCTLQRTSDCLQCCFSKYRQVFLHQTHRCDSACGSQLGKQRTHKPCPGCGGEKLMRTCCSLFCLGIPGTSKNGNNQR